VRGLGLDEKPLDCGTEGGNNVRADKVAEPSATVAIQTLIASRAGRCE